MVFWSLSCYKELKLTTNRFTGRTLRGPLIQLQNISLRSSHAQKAKFRDTFFCDTAVLTFTFRFLSSLLFSLFLPHFFFSCWAFKFKVPTKSHRVWATCGSTSEKRRNASIGRCQSTPPIVRMHSSTLGICKCTNDEFQF